MLFVPILLPLLGGLLLFFKGSKNLKATMNFYVWLTGICVVSMAFFQPDATIFGYFPFHIVLALYLDEIGFFFSMIFVVVWLVVLPYALDYLQHDENQTRFFAAFLALFGAMLGLCYAQNLITFYLFFELVSICCVLLVVHEQTEAAIQACKKFFYYSMAGAFLGMVSIFYFYALKSQHPTEISMKFNPGGIAAILEYGDYHSILGFSLLAIVGFGCKAGMFPLQGWLKTAHPIAPAPASAILSGITTKAGVLAILRVLYYVVGVDVLRGTYVQYFGLLLTILTIFMGSMLAFREKVLKTRLAYSTVSQVSYILFALLLFHEYAFIGAMLHAIFHAFSKTLLFLCAGTMIHEGGIHRVDQVGGLGKKLQKTFLLFTIASLSLIGLPFTGGLISKWYIAVGAVSSNSGLGHFGVVVIMISALLTGGYLLPICTQGFFGTASEDAEKREIHPPKGEKATYCLGILLCLFGTISAPLLEFLSYITKLLGLGGGL